MVGPDDPEHVPYVFVVRFWMLYYTIWKVTLATLATSVWHKQKFIAHVQQMLNRQPNDRKPFGTTFGTRIRTNPNRPTAALGVNNSIPHSIHNACCIVLQTKEVYTIVIPKTIRSLSAES